MIIATLTTKPLYAVRKGESRTEAGTFTLPVLLPEIYLTQSLEPRRLVITTIAAHLSSACRDTGTESSMWRVDVEEPIAREFSIAPILDMSALDNMGAPV